MLQKRVFTCKDRWWYNRNWATFCRNFADRPSCRRQQIEDRGLERVLWHDGAGLAARKVETHVLHCGYFVELGGALWKLLKNGRSISISCNIWRWYSREPRPVCCAIRARELRYGIVFCSGFEVQRTFLAFSICRICEASSVWNVLRASISSIHESPI